MSYATPPTTYKQFIFDRYEFDPETGKLDLHYGLDNKLHFVERYQFHGEFVAYNPEQLDRALQSLFFMAGASYYKTYIPAEIVVRQGQLDQASADFYSKTYQRGLGEFWYVNKFDPHTPVTFPVTTADTLQPVAGQGSGKLIAVGGGKDSLVSIELLRDKDSITTWSMDHRPQLQPLVDRIGLPHVWVDREWDRQLVDLNQQGALNGHIPISGIFACAGVIIAILTGKQDVVMSNEQSANEPTLHYDGVAINHQYSKSQEFERDFQSLLRHLFGETVRYYSFLRPLSEVRITQLFAERGILDKYIDVFSSCNRAFVHTSDHMSWCGHCAKCAFVYLALSSFAPREKVESIWGKNLLTDPELEPLYRNLLGIEGDKPLDCVGEVKESRAAMRLAEQTHPELTGKYHYDIPADYDYAALGSHEMPPEVYEIFKTANP